MESTKERYLFSKLLSKFAEKSPFKYVLTLCLSSLSLIQIISISDELLVKRFKKLETLFDSLLISAKVVDHAKLQYTNFMSNNKVMEKIEQFDTSKDRADEFHTTIFSDITKFPELEEVVKVCIILSHGNARVESGFSISELLLDINMKDQSLVAQHIVYEGVMKVALSKLIY